MQMRVDTRAQITLKPAFFVHSKKHATKEANIGESPRRPKSPTGLVSRQLIGLLYIYIYTHACGVCKLSLGNPNAMQEISFAWTSSAHSLYPDNMLHHQQHDTTFKEIVDQVVMSLTPAGAGASGHPARPG